MSRIPTTGRGAGVGIPTGSRPNGEFPGFAPWHPACSVQPSMQCDRGADERFEALGVVAEPFDGVGYVRFGLPFGRLATRGIGLRTLGSRIELRREGRLLRPAPAALDGVAALVFPQLVGSPVLADGSRVDLVGGLCELAAARGIPVVYSVDDHLPSATPDNPNHARISASLDNLETIRRHAGSIVATTPTLARAFEAWGLPTRVLPNTIDPARWRPRPRRREGPPTIGWAGSATHLDDLLLVAPTLVELQRRVPFRFVLYGLCDLPLEEQRARVETERERLDDVQRDRAASFLRLHDMLRALDVRHVPFGGLDDYIGRLPRLDLDVGLCPLRDTPFNRAKSALKFYEYAACGTLCVASDVDPYRSEVSHLARDARDWAGLLERFLRDADARDREQVRQHDWVVAERSIDRWTDHWEAALRDAPRRATGADNLTTTGARDVEDRD